MVHHRLFFVVADDVEVTNFNWPKDKVFDWMLGPLLVIKEQMKKLEITEDEELCLRKLIVTNENERNIRLGRLWFPLKRQCKESTATSDNQKVARNCSQYVPDTELQGTVHQSGQGVVFGGDRGRCHRWIAEHIAQT